MNLYDYRIKNEQISTYINAIYINTTVTAKLSPENEMIIITKLLLHQYPRKQSSSLAHLVQGLGEILVQVQSKKTSHRHTGNISTTDSITNCTMAVPT